jgi:hypothetical protein
VVRSVPTEIRMPAPFRVGDPAVFVELDDEGMRATRVAVLRVEPVGDAWGVETTLGRDVVDANGEGSRLVPLDAEMAVEFEERGPSFVVRSTVQDIEEGLDQSLDWRRFEHDLARDDTDRDTGRDYGPER